MSAHIEHLPPMSDELYRARMETFGAMVTVYATDTGEVGLTVSGLDLKRKQLALMNRDDVAALRYMLTAALEAQGVPA